MPKPSHSQRTYFPGLDGIRALAIVALLAAGLGLGGLSGGEIGFSVFFALSGYLITDLLLAQVGTGRVDLADFWLGRAARILPALVVMLAVTIAWVTLVGPRQGEGLQAAAVSALANVNNLWLIGESSSYLSLLHAPGPFDHLWALSIVAQFYVVWPLLLIIGLRIAPRVSRASGARWGLCGLIIGLAALSLLLTALLYSEFNPVRTYYGTIFRASEVLIGAALAAAYPSSRPAGATARRTALAGALGFVGLGLIVALVLADGALGPAAFRAGFAVAAIATDLLIVAAMHRTTVIARLLGARIPVWIGVRSYGIFIWYLPVIVLSSPDGYPDPNPLRCVLQVGATFALAAASWRYVEEPIRGGWLGRAWERWRAGAAPPGRPAQAALLAAGAVLGVAGVGFVGAATNSSPGFPGDVEVAAVETSEDVTYAPHTSCERVAHIGDATSIGLLSDELPARDRLGAQYEVAGVTERRLEVAPTRFISARFGSEASAEEIAGSLRSSGYEGCWVLALGIDDVAAVGAGSVAELSDRIDSMMAGLDGQPVMWVNLKTQLDSGPLADGRMERWNAALRDACGRYPGMRIFDWAAATRSGWFEADGVLLTDRGDRARAGSIAAALSAAFPAADGGDREGDCEIDLPPAMVGQLTAAPEPFDISFAGDITPGSSYGLPPDDARSMFGSVRADLRGSDLAIGNLEGTLSVGGASKCGADTSTCFSFQAPPVNAKGLRWAGFDLLSVANNHAFDFGADGQQQTLKALARERLLYAGLPDQVTITDVGSTRVAVIGFAPYEWSNSVADRDREAALIGTARGRADVVIVVAHLGAEGADQGHTPVGTEYAFGEDRGDSRAFARGAIDAGAALVLASGPHVLRGMERYRDGLIAYSLGNFAGWDNFSTAGSLGISALLGVDVSGSGRPVGGRVIPLRLVEPGVPTPDPDRTAITTMNALSEQDFGADGIRLDENGEFKLADGGG